MYDDLLRVIIFLLEDHHLADEEGRVWLPHEALHITGQEIMIESDEERGDEGVYLSKQASPEKKPGHTWPPIVRGEG